MRLYVAGPMSGLPKFNYNQFMQAATDLRHAGYDVENPAENPVCEDWVGYMRLSLRQISNSDGLAVLPDWQLSRGASLEVHIAHSLLLPVLAVDRWIESSHLRAAS